MAYQASEWTPDGVPRSGEWFVRELLNCVVRRPWGKFSETVSGHENPRLSRVLCTRHVIPDVS